MNERSGELPPVLFHVDCDGAREIFAYHGRAFASNVDPLFESGLANALDFFDTHRVKATFFVIARGLESPEGRRLYAEVVRRGHEVASHTTTHRLLPTLDRAEKEREIVGSKRLIEAALDRPCEGFRAPAFAVDPESFALIERAGYRYDSSLFPDRASAVKAGQGFLGPHPSHLERTPKLLELPLPRHRPLPWPFHPSYALVLGGWYFRLGLALARGNGAPLTLLFHLTDFANPLESTLVPDRKTRLFTLSHLSAVAKRRRLTAMIKALQDRYRPDITSAVGASSVKA